MMLETPPVRLKIAIVLLLCVAIVLRFTSLDSHIFWFDEAVNALHATGYHKINFLQQMRSLQGQIFTVEQLQAYQYPQPGKSWIETIAVLASGEPQSPPLYYLLSRCWVQIFGQSVAVYRSLSAIVSLFLFPATYWLAWELFRSRTIAWIAMGIVAVSPIYFLFSLEVRPYILWLVAIAVSSAIFLRAFRLQKRNLWRGYAASLILGLYTFPFTALVAISHGIYIAIVDKLPLTRRAIDYLKACAIAFVAFLPWAISVLTINNQKMGDWRQIFMTKLELLNSWIANISFTFFDVSPDYIKSRRLWESFDSYFLAAMSFLVAAFCLFAIYYCWRRSSPKSAIFLGSLMAVTAGVLVFPDLIFGGRRSTVARYFMPCYLGIQLSAAYLLGHQIYTASKRDWQQKFWLVVAIVIFSLETVSCISIARSPYWWHKDFNRQDVAMVEIVNSADNPLIVSPVNWWAVFNTISMSHRLDRDTEVVFFPRTDLYKMPRDRDNLFIFYPFQDRSEEELEANTGLQLETVYQNDPFWLLEVQPPSARENEA